MCATDLSEVWEAHLLQRQSHLANQNVSREKRLIVIHLHEQRGLQTFQFTAVEIVSSILAARAVSVRSMCFA